MARKPKTFKSESAVLQAMDKEIRTKELLKYVCPHERSLFCLFDRPDGSDKTDNIFTLLLELGEDTDTPISAFVDSEEGLRKYFEEHLGVEIEVLDDPGSKINISNGYYETYPDVTFVIHFRIINWYLLDLLVEQIEIERLRFEEAERALKAKRILAKKNAKEATLEAERKLLAKLLKKHGTPNE